MVSLLTNKPSLKHQGDDYISNFTPWPALRDTRNATFRSDAFVHLIASSLKIQWSECIHDCYTRDTSTGLYAIAPEFDEAIFDLRSWSFEADFFVRYPVLYGLATVANGIPRGVDGGEGGMVTRRLRSRGDSVMREVDVVSSGNKD